MTNAGFSIFRRRREQRRRPFVTFGDLSAALLYAMARFAVLINSPKFWRISSCLALKSERVIKPKAIADIARCLPLSDSHIHHVLRDNRRLKHERLFQIASINAGKDLPVRIDVSGLDHLNAALSLGKGAVLWVAHFSHSSLITKVAFHQAGHALTHISRVEHGFSKSWLGVRALNRLRQSAEDIFLAGRLVVNDVHVSTLLRARRLLKSNGLVSITAGAWEGMTIARSPLFAGQLDLSIGAPKLAFANQAQLLYVFTAWDEEAGAYLTKILAPQMSFDRKVSEAEFIEGTVRDFLARHEAEVARYPEQWDGWKYLKV